MSFDELLYEAFASFLFVLCRLISCYQDKFYHIAPLEFGEGGAIVLLSA